MATLDNATTWLYVPADRVATLLPKALAAADGVVIDLEDAVHPSARPAARIQLAEALAARPSAPVAVRVNRVGSEDFARDIEAVAPLLAADLVAGVRLPKVESAAEVAAAWAATSPHLPTPHLVPLVESAPGLTAATAIARAEGVAGLTLGESDLRADLGLPRDGSEDGLLLARLTIVQACATAGLPSPTASVFANITDLDALAASCTTLRRLGFHGRSVIHPGQIGTVRAAFAPSTSEADWARDVVQRAGSMELDEQGAAKLADGSFVDPAIVRQAHRILDRLPSPVAAP